MTKASQKKKDTAKVSAAATVDDGEPPFNMIAYNNQVKLAWDKIQAQIDSLSDAQCLRLVHRQQSDREGHRELGKAFSRLVRAGWDGAMAEIAGGAVYRAILSRLNMFDDVYRPAPAIIPMGEFEECLVFYHTVDAQFEVFRGTKRQRFPALFNPLQGMDIEDMRMVVEIIRRWKTSESRAEAA